MHIFRDMWMPPVKNGWFDAEKSCLCFWRFFVVIVVTLMTSIIFLAVGSFEIRLESQKCKVLAVHLII